jgi:DNA-binding transcriptional ArsR family regulator
MDAVFKAITDPHRRMLLDALYERDGQTLAELCEHLPGMTRQGVMNHLGVLEGSDLITTLRDGRSKYHYLNPVPIRLIHDRWISRYADARLGRMVGIKRHAEAGGRGMDRPIHIYKTYIRASADDV